MRIDRVIFAWDGHPAYDGMWEVHCQVWPKLGITPTLMLFSGVPAPVTPFGCDVRVIEPAAGVLRLDPPARNWQATIPLIYAPQFFPNEVVMTSGIDQVPMSRQFIDAVADVADDAFLVAFGGVRDYETHSEAFGCPYYPSSHMVASGSLWAKVLDGTPKNFPEFAKWVWESGFPAMWGGGWGLDEATISQLLARHQEVPLVKFSSEWFDDWDSRRVDADRHGRGHSKCIQSLLESGYYSEIHLNHPPLQHQWEIIQQVSASLK